MKLDEQKLIAMLKMETTNAEFKSLGLTEDEIDGFREIFKNVNVNEDEALQKMKSLLSRWEEMDKRRAEKRVKL